MVALNLVLEDCVVAMPAIAQTAGGGLVEKAAGDDDRGGHGCLAMARQIVLRHLIKRKKRM